MRSHLNLVFCCLVSRLYAHSKNYDMDLTLDYNIELFPLQSGESFALALSSSLQRGGASKTDDEEEKEQDVWRPDGKGRRGLEDDYDYVMYGKVRISTLYSPCAFETANLLFSRCTSLMGPPAISCMCRSGDGNFALADFSPLQDRICLVWWPPHVTNGLVSPSDKHRFG